MMYSSTAVISKPMFTVVLAKLRDNQLFMKGEKCEFHLEFLQFPTRSKSGKDFEDLPTFTNDLSIIIVAVQLHLPPCLRERLKNYVGMKRRSVH